MVQERLNQCAWQFHKLSNNVVMMFYIEFLKTDVKFVAAAVNHDQELMRGKPLTNKFETSKEMGGAENC